MPRPLPVRYSAPTQPTPHNTHHTLVLMPAAATASDVPDWVTNDDDEDAAMDDILEELEFALATRTCIVVGGFVCRFVCMLQMYVDLYVALCEHFGTFLRASDASTLAHFAGIKGTGQCS